MPGTNALREECGVFRYAPDATLLPQTQQLTASLLAYFYSATLVWFYSDLDKGCIQRVADSCLMVEITNLHWHLLQFADD